MVPYWDMMKRNKKLAFTTERNYTHVHTHTHNFLKNKAATKKPTNFMN